MQQSYASPTHNPSFVQQCPCAGLVPGTKLGAYQWLILSLLADLLALICWRNGLINGHSLRCWGEKLPVT